MDLLFQIQRLIRGIMGRTEMKWLIFLLVLYLVARVVARYLQQRAKSEKESQESGDFDLSDLERVSVEGEQYPLRLYHLPARLGLVVVAPLGRESAAVEVDAIQDLIDQAVPGLGKISQASRVKTWVWPLQLSVNGFIHHLLGHVHVRGGDLKGSRWSLVAGRVSHADRQYMLGLGVYTNESNKMGIISVESEYKWLDTLRLPRGERE